jgi:hypothetical protein
LEQEVDENVRDDQADRQDGEVTSRDVVAQREQCRPEP